MIAENRRNLIIHICLIIKCLNKLWNTFLFTIIYPVKKMPDLAAHAAPPH